MNAKQLKDSILEYAMQGKLVDNIDDSAFKGIWEREIHSNKKVNQILDHEIPFDIPSTWVWARVGDLGIVKTGNTPSTSNLGYYNEKYIPFIKPGDFIEGSLNYNNEYLSEKGAEKARIIGENSILMVCIGGSRGKCAYNDRIIACNQQINTLSINSNLINLQYIFYIMQSNYFQNLMIERATGTATPIVNKTNWSNFIIPVAPIEEQIKIVEKINELFLKVKGYENSYQKIEDLNYKFPKELEKSILQYAMQGKLVEQDSNDESAQKLIEKIKFEKERLIKEKVIKKEKTLPPITEEEIPFDIPSSWEWVRLKEISTFGNFETVKPELISDEEWILDLEEIEKNTGKLIQVVFNSDKKVKSNKYKFKSGDVLYGKLRPYLNKVIIAPNEGYCTTEIFPITLLGNIAPKYLQMALMSPYFLSYANSCSYGVKMPRLGTNQLAEALIPLPPLNEQKRIINKVDELLTVSKQLIK